MKNEIHPVSIYPSPKMGSVLHLAWMLHNLCNYRCSYCQEVNWNGSDRWLKFDSVVSFLDKVFSHYKKDVFHISFTGGEPTLWPEFLKLCQYLKSLGCEIGLTSNGSRRPDYWEKLAPLLNWVCLSYHSEFADDAHFYNLAKLLKSHESLRATVRLMMHPKADLWQRALKMAEKISQIDSRGSLHFEYVPLQENFGFSNRLMDYSTEQQRLFAKPTHFAVQVEKFTFELAGCDVNDMEMKMNDGTTHNLRTNDLVAHQMVNFHGWNCYIGVDQLFVNHLGHVRKSGCSQGQMIGHIFDQTILFPTEAVRCGVNFCPCGTDIQTRKHKS